MTALTFTACPARHAGPCDAVLSDRTVVETLESHGFEARVTEAGRIEAFEPSTTFPLDGSPAFDSSTWITVPSGVHGLALWLGY
jgi:hypothetical protein